MTDSSKAPNDPRAETASAPGMPTQDDDARLRALIGAELDRQHALPVARKTLEMIVEAGSEPAEGTPGYRIVDRSGDTRLKPVSAEQAKKGVLPDTPLTLAEFVDELRERYPELFGTAPPPSETVAQSEPQATLQDKMAQVKAVGARFVQTQSSLARSLATNSAERGRALAAAAGQTLEGWRSQIDERRHAPPPSEPEPNAASAQALAEPRTADTSSPPTQPPASRVRRNWRQDALLRFKRGAARFRSDRADQPALVSDPQTVTAVQGAAPTSRRRIYAVALAGLGGVALALVLLSSNRGARDTTVSDAPAVRPQAEAAPPPSVEAAQKPPAPAPSLAPAPSPVPANPPVDLEEQPDDAPVRQANEISGVPEVIDTATLRLAGKVVRLFGVEWVRGGQSEDLLKYLARRAVVCQPAPGSSAYLCTVDGRDLSEVVLFNGGGRASPEAGPALVAAEDHARSERLGVWKR